jgi:hypothetical protein
MEITRDGVLLTYAEFNMLLTDAEKASGIRRGGRPKGSKNKPKAGTKRTRKAATPTS